MAIPRPIHPSFPSSPLFIRAAKAQIRVVQATLLYRDMNRTHRRNGKGRQASWGCSNGCEARSLAFLVAPGPLRPGPLGQVGGSWRRHVQGSGIPARPVWLCTATLFTRAQRQSVLPLLGHDANVQRSCTSLYWVIRPNTSIIAEQRPILRDRPAAPDTKLGQSLFFSRNPKPAASPPCHGPSLPLPTFLLSLARNEPNPMPNKPPDKIDQKPTRTHTAPPPTDHSSPLPSPR
jgi:hypothetical protein